MNNQNVSWDANADLKLTPEMSFSDLRVRFGTFHYQTIKLSQGDKRTVTRNGKMTKLGDIEESVWCRLIKELITREGEDELHSHLLE